MGGDLSDDDSIHLYTPPKGSGRCCAGRFCLHTRSRYFPSGLCSDCHGYAHDKDCIKTGYAAVWFPDTPLVCMLCVFKHHQNETKAQEKEKRKVREASRKIVKLKTSEAMEILNQTNPFNYNQMQKVLKEKKLSGFLKAELKKKCKRKKV